MKVSLGFLPPFTTISTSPWNSLPVTETKSGTGSPPGSLLYTLNAFLKVQPSTISFEKLSLFVKRKFEVIVESRRISSLVVCNELEPRVMARLEMLARRREESGQGRGSWRLRSKAGQSSTLNELGGSFNVSGITPELQRKCRVELRLKLTSITWAGRLPDSWASPRWETSW